ncbi:MAG: C40 family peptidase [Mycobacterium sp.]|nr:C40 family peptidase [Mycobacterium sp.]
MSVDSFGTSAKDTSSITGGGGSAFPKHPTPRQPVPGPNPGDPPYPNGAEPTMAKGHLTHLRPGLGEVSDTIPLTDDPPGYAPAAGTQREHNWFNYLNGINADSTHRALGELPKALPRPEAVNDPALRTIGAAARQQGVSYAWGGNQSVDGPTTGTLEDDPPDGDAHRHRDDLRTGFDCGGLARFAVYQGYGTDIKADTGIQFTTLGGAASAITDPRPGDLAYWGPNGAKHVAINLGNGVLIEAFQSGAPVQVMSLAATNASQGQAPVWMRPHYSHAPPSA